MLLRVSYQRRARTRAPPPGAPRARCCKPAATAAACRSARALPIHARRRPADPPPSRAAAPPRAPRAREFARHHRPAPQRGAASAARPAGAALRLQPAMNSESAALLRAREQLVEKHGGLEAFRRHVQRHYRLKTVIRVRPGMAAAAPRRRPWGAPRGRRRQGPNDCVAAPPRRRATTRGSSRCSSTTWPATRPTWWPPWARTRWARAPPAGGGPHWSACSLARVRLLQLRAPRCRPAGHGVRRPAHGRLHGHGGAL